MQDLNEKMLKEATVGVDLGSKAGDCSVEKGVFQPNKEKRKGVYFPDYWKKKKLNRAFVDELEKAATSEPFMKDEYGEYRLGTFLHGCAIVKVEIVDDLLSIAIHSKHILGYPMVKEIRYKFAPNAYLMTMLMPSREQQISDNTVVLYQIPGSFGEDDTEDPIFEEKEEYGAK